VADVTRDNGVRETREPAIKERASGERATRVRGTSVRGGRELGTRELGARELGARELGVAAREITIPGRRARGNVVPGAREAEAGRGLELRAPVGVVR